MVFAVHSPTALDCLHIYLLLQLVCVCEALARLGKHCPFLFQGGHSACLASKLYMCAGESRYVGREGGAGTLHALLHSNALCMFLH